MFLTPLRKNTGCVLELHFSLLPSTLIFKRDYSEILSMSFMSTFNTNGLNFESNADWDATSMNSECNLSPVDMHMTPRRSARLLEARLDDNDDNTHSARPPPRIRIPLTKKPVSESRAGRLLRSGTLVPSPSPRHHTRGSPFQSPSQRSLAVAESPKLAAASANPLESTLMPPIEEEVDEEIDEEEIAVPRIRIPLKKPVAESTPGKVLRSGTVVPSPSPRHRTTDSPSSRKSVASSSGDSVHNYVPTDEEEEVPMNEEDNTEDENVDVEEETTTDRPPDVADVKKRRDRNIYSGAKPWNNGVKEHFTDDELPSELMVLAQQEFDGNKYNRLNWKKEWPTDSEGKMKTRRVHKCHYKNESDCRFQLVTVRDNETGLSCIYIGNRPHSDHSINKKRRGPSSKVIAAVVSSPNALRKKGTKSLVNSVMFDKKIAMSKAEQRKTQRAVGRLRRELDKDILGGLDGSTYEGLDKKLSSYQKELLELEDDFDQNTFFLCGSYICDGSIPESARIAAMFSTGNCLVNLYRYTCTGYDLTFCIDTSYRYTIQGFGLMPVKVVDLSQTGHTVAYGLVNIEDTEAHNFLLYQLRDECERTIEQYRVSGYFDP